MQDSALSFPCRPASNCAYPCYDGARRFRQLVSFDEPKRHVRIIEPPEIYGIYFLSFEVDDYSSSRSHPGRPYASQQTKMHCKRAKMGNSCKINTYRLIDRRKNLSFTFVTGVSANSAALGYWYSSTIFFCFLFVVRCFYVVSRFTASSPALGYELY